MTHKSNTRHWLPNPRHLVRSLIYRDDANIFSVLQIPDYRNLWIGQMISFVGDALAYNTLTLAIIRMANDADMSSGKLLSVLFVLSALPSLFLGMIAGTIADRSNRKHLMIVTDIVRGVLVLGFLLVKDIDHIWIYTVVSIALSSVSTFFYPARTAILPLILGKERLLAGNALAQLTSTLSFVVGAALAGVMVGAAQATAPSFILDSLSFFVSAYFIARISINGRVDQQQPDPSRDAPPSSAAFQRTFANAYRTLRTIIGELAIGLRYVFSDQIMRGVLISFLAMMLGLGAANVTFVPLLINELGMREEGLGLVRFSQTIGIIIGSATITTAFTARFRPGSLIGASMMAFGVTTIMVSVIHSYSVMIGVLFLVGLAIAPPQIVASTLMQRHVPSEKLGRASGAQGAIVNVANIASMGAAGLLMDEIGARLVFTFAGVLIFCAGIMSWWVLRGVEDHPGEDEGSQHPITEKERLSIEPLFESDQPDIVTA